MKNNNYLKISIIYFISLIAVAIIFTLSSFGFLINDYLSTFLIQIVVMFGVPMLLYTALVSKNFKQTFKDAGFKKISGRMIIITIFLGLVLYIINSFVANFFQSVISILGYENLFKSTVELNNTFLLKEFFLSCLLPGICEEFLHRGLLLFAGKKVQNTRYCLIISSILFGLTHLNIMQFFYASILGILIGIVGIVSNSIFPCMIIHFMNNFLNTYFAYGKYYNLPIATIVDNILTVISSNIMLYVILSSLIAIIAIYAYKYLVKMLKKERSVYNIKQIIKDYQKGKINIEDSQYAIDKILDNVKINELYLDGNKPNFQNRFVVISSICLGAMITICSFIWGIL